MIKQKLKSTSGATILIALLFFLMCALAGSVVLAAGSAAAGRLSGLEEKQESYYAVTSAAKLIQQELEGQDLMFTENAFTSGNWKDCLYFNVNEINKDSLKAPREFTISVNIESATSGTIGTVKGYVTIYKDYSIDILFKKDGTENGNYSCTLHMPAVPYETDTDQEGNPTTGKPTQIIWSGGTIEKGNVAVTEATAG